MRRLIGYQIIATNPKNIANIIPSIPAITPAFARVKLLSNATYLIREKARLTNNSDVIYSGKMMKYIIF